MERRSGANSAFTLVELLVVITIIAVLAALLVPALSSAEGRAKTAQCGNDERQVGVGFASYPSSNGGVTQWYDNQFPGPSHPYQ